MPPFMGRLTDEQHGKDGCIRRVRFRTRRRRAGNRQLPEHRRRLRLTPRFLSGGAIYIAVYSGSSNRTDESVRATAYALRIRQQESDSGIMTGTAARGKS